VCEGLLVSLGDAAILVLICFLRNTAQIQCGTVLSGT